MTLTLDLPPELEERLNRAAQQKGLPPSQCALNVLEQGLPPADRRAELRRLIRKWLEDDDPEEQRETGDYLIRVLDEDRLSDRKLYPPELEGITW